MYNASTKWWRDAVIYQVYLRSFADQNGDGIGDLAGLKSRLAYLKDLGVDGIWINPCYPSPQVDHGYDILNYEDIDTVYGDLDQFDGLVRDIHDLELKLLMDLVPNHCSVEHPWFRSALRSNRNSKERERFIFRDGRGPDGEQPPNDWRSAFGGPAWTRTLDGQWYLHMFDAAQPDFNWHNRNVQEFFDRVMRFWFDRGIDGFRVDVPTTIIKPINLEQHETSSMVGQDRPELHAIYRRWRSICESYSLRREVTLVGEFWDADIATSSANSREFHQAFYFDLLVQPWSAAAWRRAIDGALNKFDDESRIVWTLANHDVHRQVTRYGIVRRNSDSCHPIIAALRPRGQINVEQGERRARAALLGLLMLPGAQYIYQGEELGLPEVLDLPDDVRQDPGWKISDGSDPGRDGCRIPLPWSSEPPSFGFTCGCEEVASWLPQPEWFGKYAAYDQIKDAGSTLNLYRSALHARRSLRDPYREEKFSWGESPEDIVLYYRGSEFACVINFGDEVYSLPVGYRTVIASGHISSDELPGSTAVWLQRE